MGPLVRFIILRSTGNCSQRGAVVALGVLVVAPSQTKLRSRAHAGLSVAPHQTHIHPLQMKGKRGGRWVLRTTDMRRGTMPRRPMAYAFTKKPARIATFYAAISRFVLDVPLFPATHCL